MGIKIDDLSSMHIDVLREIGNIGAGNAATALAKILNKKVDMDVPKVKIIEFKDISGILEDPESPVIGILLRVTGDLSGDIMFMLDFKAAHILVNILMGKPVEDMTDFDEMEYSALKEIGNILAGSYLSALSALTSLKIMPSVPDIAIDMAGAILSVPAIEFGKVGDSVLYIETAFIEGATRVMGDFFLVPDIDSYEILLKALGVIS